MGSVTKADIDAMVEGTTVARGLDRTFRKRTVRVMSKPAVTMSLPSTSNVTGATSGFPSADEVAKRISGWEAR